MLSEEMTCGKAQRVGILGKATECRNREEKDRPRTGAREENLRPHAAGARPFALSRRHNPSADQKPQ